MKKVLMLLTVLLMFMGISQAQKTEVLYFKTELPCCRAKACDALEADLKTIVERNFTDGSVVFRQVKLADEANKAIVDKYNAKSQTVVVVTTIKKNEISNDVSEVVRNYIRTGNKDLLEKEFVAKIKGGIK